jgi:energy-coupling factor transporter ATP-binding protein EcfA2
MMEARNIVLNVNGIEVIYNHVILVLKGVSLQVPEGRHRGAAGGNGAGKTTTLRAISNLLQGERGEVTKGSIELRGERIENLSPADLVQARRGAGDGGPALLRPPHHRREPADRLLHAHQQGRSGGQPGEGLRLLPAPEAAPHLAGGLHLGRRAADVRHRPRADGQPQHGAARRALDGPGAADRRGSVRDREGPERRRSASPSCWPSRTPTWR